MKEIEKIKPSGIFTNYIYKAIPLAFDESMSYYETLCALLDYLKNTIIPTVNNNADAVAELQNLYIELKTYVDDYFTNLDVQEEINNKLDAMAEDGTLQEIISNFLKIKSLLCFDTVSDMIASNNLVVGSYAKTLGFHNINDGGNAIYKIIENNNSANGYNKILLNNNLIAELIVENTINIKQFGAYGNNVNDDTQCFQNAITYMKNNNIYNFYIPNGTYLISETLNFVKQSETFNIYGENTQKTILKCTSDILEFIKLSEGTNENDRINFKYYMHDLTIDGNNYANIVINAWLCAYSTLERVKIIGNKENSILLKISCWVNRIINCIIRGYDNYIDSQGFKYVPLTGIEISKFLTLNNIIIQNNDFAYLRRAINCTQDINQMLIQGNSFDQCGKVIVSTSRIHQLDICDNYFEGVGGNKTTVYNLDTIVYNYSNNYTINLNSPFIFYEDNRNANQYKNSISFKNNTFASCVYEKLIAISNPLKFDFKENSIYGFNYLTNVILYDNLILFFGMGGIKFSELNIEWKYPINNIIIYDINTANFFYDYSIKNLDLMYDNITNKREVEKSQYNNSDITNETLINVNNVKRLSVTINLSDIDKNNLNPIIGNCENGTYKVTLQEYNEDSSSWVNIDVDRNYNVTDNILYINLSRFNITKNKLKITIYKADENELKIKDIYYIPTNKYLSNISLL